VDWRGQIDPNAPVGPDGNSVSLDREAVKIASNTLRYDALSGMIRGKLNGLQWAAQGGR
jgi:flagellar basal body rod protein FlgB